MLQKIDKFFIIFGLSLLLFPINICSDSAEFRGFWVTIWDMDSKASIETVVQKAHQYYFNQIYAHIRVRGDAYYYPNRRDSRYKNIEPRTEAYSLSPSDLDALQYLIDLAHNQNPPIQVHAWVVVFPAWNRSSKPVSANHVYNAHPEWVTENADGVTMPWDGNGGEGSFLDSGIPAVRDYLFNVFMDIVRNYDIDGLHLDYIRFPNTTYGYDPVAKAKFKEETGYDLSVDSGIDAVWNMWRRTNISKLVKKLHQGIKAEKPWVKLSGAIVTFTDAPIGVLSSYDQWATKGYVDHLIPMVYSETMTYVQPRVQTMQDRVGNVPVIAGLGSGSENTGDGMVAKINALRTQSNPVEGFVFFSYGGLAANSDEKFKAISGAGKPFSSDAPIPDYPNENADKIPPLPPNNVSVTSSQGKVTITFSKPSAASDGDYPVKYRIYCSTDSTVPLYWNNLKMEFWQQSHQSDNYNWEDYSLPGSNVYYKIVAYDDYNNMAYVLRNVSSTSANMIIEARSPGLNSQYYSEQSGDWANSSSHSKATGLTSDIGSRYCTLATKNDKCRFSPTLTTSGSYEIFITTYNYSSANAANTKITVHHKNGDTVIYRDITMGNCGDKWYSLGTYEFLEGANNTYVELDTSTCTTGDTNRLNADAMKWEFKGSQQPIAWEPIPQFEIKSDPIQQTIIVDNTPERPDTYSDSYDYFLNYQDTSSWINSVYSNFYGINKRYMMNPTTKAIWIAYIPQAGKYNLKAYINYGPYTDTAKYRINTASGLFNATCSQQNVANGFNININGSIPLNLYEGYVYVTISDSDNDGKYLIADAIKFEYIIDTLPLYWMFY